MQVSMAGFAHARQVRWVNRALCVMGNRIDVVRVQLSCRRAQNAFEAIGAMRRKRMLDRPRANQLASGSHASTPKVGLRPSWNPSAAGAASRRKVRVTPPLIPRLLDVRQVPYRPRIRAPQSMLAKLILDLIRRNARVCRDLGRRQSSVPKAGQPLRISVCVNPVDCKLGTIFPTRYLARTHAKPDGIFQALPARAGQKLVVHGRKDLLTVCQRNSEDRLVAGEYDVSNRRMIDLAARLVARTQLHRGNPAPQRLTVEAGRLMPSNKIGSAHAISLSATEDTRYSRAAGQ